MGTSSRDIVTGCDWDLKKDEESFKAGLSGYHEELELCLSSSPTPLLRSYVYSSQLFNFSESQFLLQMLTFIYTSQGLGEN